MKEYNYDLHINCFLCQIPLLAKPESLAPQALLVPLAPQVATGFQGPWVCQASQAPKAPVGTGDDVEELDLLESQGPRESEECRDPPEEREPLDLRDLQGHQVQYTKQYIKL